MHEATRGCQSSPCTPSESRKKISACEQRSELDDQLLSRYALLQHIQPGLDRLEPFANDFRVRLRLQLAVPKSTRNKISPDGILHFLWILCYLIGSHC